MDISIDEIRDIEDIIEELESINERVIKAKTNFDNAMKALHDLGFDSIEKATIFLKKSESQRQNRTIKLETSITAIKKEYNDTLNRNN